MAILDKKKSKVSDRVPSSSMADIAAVKTRPTAPYKYMVDVLDGLLAAGAIRISLQLFEG